jgi:hypothetical protein
MNNTRSPERQNIKKTDITSLSETVDKNKNTI